MILDLRRLSNAIDFFVVATSESQRQSKAIAENIEAALHKEKQRVWHIEGFSRKGSQKSQVKSGFSKRHSYLASDTSPLHEKFYDEEPSWFLMDCQDVVIHILNPAARDFYKIEKLWGDAPHLKFDFR